MKIENFSSIKSSSIVSKVSVLCLSIQLYRDGDELPTAKQVYNKFVSLYSKDDAEDVFGSDSEYDEWRKVIGASKHYFDDLTSWIKIGTKFQIFC